MTDKASKVEVEEPEQQEQGEPAQLSPERADKRVHVALPLRITYWDKDKRPGLEMACTYDISPHGARITSLRCVREEGEIVAIERGRNKAFCRVVWVGEPNSELRGQLGLQCVEPDRPLFEGELKELEESYDPILNQVAPRKLKSGDHGNRRRRPRFPIEGIAELLKNERKGAQHALLKDLSEMGCLVTTKQMLLPGTDLKLVLSVANYTLSLKGQVRHSALDVGVGVQFNEIRKGDRQTLRYLLRKLEEQGFEDAFEVEIK